MPKEFSRGRRIGDHIQQELAVLIQQEIKDPRLGMVTISEVKVSRDLAYADVYFTLIGPDLSKSNVDEGTKVLNSAAGFLRSQLARSLTTRVTPKLRFHFDNTIEKGAHLSRVINQALAEDARVSMARGDAPADGDAEAQEDNKDG